MFTQSVSWEKKSNMQSQDELYSFLGDRVGGFHISVVRVVLGGFIFVESGP